MLGDISRFLLDIAFTLLGVALIARAWMFAVRIHPFLPVTIALNQFTNWLVMPLRRVLPLRGGRIDWACVLAVWLVALIYVLLSWMLATGSLIPWQLLPHALVSSVLTAARWTLNFVFWITLGQALLSWLNPNTLSMSVLQQMTAPMLNPLRRLLPTLGGIDISPMVLILLAHVLMMILTRASYTLLGI